MRKTIRLGVGAIAGLAALLYAGQALAAYAPKLVVKMGDAGTTIHLSIPPSDDPTALLVFYAPAGTSANLSATPGSTIGTLTAQASAGALGGATLPLTGTVEVRAGDGTYLSSGQQVPLSTAATRCTGTATHAAFWVLKLTAAGQTLEVPLFADPVTGALAAAASYSLTVCLPPSDIPESLGGAAFGAKVFDANFTVKGIFTPTSSGTNVWRLRATPYTPAKGTPNAAATVEAQSYVETGSVSLGAITRTLTKLAALFRASGSVSAAGLLPGASVSVALQKGTSATKLATFARPAASASGAFSARFAVRRGAKAQRLFVRASATAPERSLDISACHATFGVSCIGATASGFTAGSSVRAIVVPARKR
jgi:hypothetical protein